MPERVETMVKRVGDGSERQKQAKQSQKKKKN